MNFDEIDLTHAPESRYSMVIRERHLDPFGHVNNAQYLILFEEARWEMVTSRGRGLDQVLAAQYGTVVLEYNVRFKRELTLRERITITTQVKSLRKKIIEIQHRILKENGEEAAEAVVSVGCFDLKNRKLVTPDPAWFNVVTGIALQQSG